jgi:O-antigen/teichoic acid export membrane protein
MSLSRFASSSMLLFIDQILLAAGGWTYWLIISKIASASEIGEATSLYNLVLLGSTLTMLGLEYPLLRRSSLERSQILGTTLVIELLISIASLPIVIYVINNFYQEELIPFIWLTTAMFVFSSLGLVPRFALLGISDARSVLTIHAMSIGIRFVAGFALVIIGFGTLGIILSFLLQFLFGAVVTLAIAKKKFSLKIGDFAYIKSILKEGLINSPSKLSYMVIFNLSIVLLASYGINSSEIGVFYIALMISTVAGSLGASMAFMAIPASSQSNLDLTSSSTRISLGLSAPLIAVLIVAPESILSIIGSEYVSAGMMLSILSLGVLPYVMTMNAISKFNNLGRPRKLILIGSVQILAFIVCFAILVPAYGTMGASLSVFVAFASSAIPSIIWSGRLLARHFASSCVAVAAGAAAGYAIHYAFAIFPITTSGSSNNYYSSIIAILFSIASSTIVIFLLKNTSLAEMRQMVKHVTKKT